MGSGIFILSKCIVVGSLPILRTCIERNIQKYISAETKNKCFWKTDHNGC